MSGRSTARLKIAELSREHASHSALSTSMDCCRRHVRANEHPNDRADAHPHVHAARNDRADVHPHSNAAPVVHCAREPCRVRDFHPSGRERRHARLATQKRSTAPAHKANRPGQRTTQLLFASSCSGTLTYRRQRFSFGFYPSSIAPNDRLAKAEMSGEQIRRSQVANCHAGFSPRPLAEFAIRTRMPFAHSFPAAFFITMLAQGGLIGTKPG